MFRALGLLFVVMLPLAAAPPVAAAGFWQGMADPHRSRVNRLVDRARSELGDRLLESRAQEGGARAEGFLREALKLDPGNHPARMLLAEALLHQGRPGDALVAFGEARTMASTLAEESASTLGLANQLVRAGRHDAALAEYDRHIRLGQAGPATYANSAGILMVQGRLAQAEERYREGLHQLARMPAGRKRDVGMALALYGLGVVADRDGRLPAAREAMARALALDPLLPGGTVLDEKLGLVSGGDGFFVPSGDIPYWHGLALMVQGRTGDAAQAMDRFVAGNPGPWKRRAEEHLLVLAAAGGENQASGRRWKLVAAVTLRADGPIPAPLIDAAWKNRPGLIDPCLKDTPVPTGDTLRVPVVLEIDARGGVDKVKAELAAEWRDLAACLELRIGQGLRVPRPNRPAPTKARLELLLGLVR